MKRIHFLSLIIWISATLIYCISMAAYAKEAALKFTGTIDKVGYDFDSGGVTDIVITLAEYPEKTFLISPKYGKQVGFKKILNIYKDSGEKAIGGKIRTFRNEDEATGYKKRRISLICNRSESEEYLIKTLTWLNK